MTPGRSDPETPAMRSDYWIVADAPLCRSSSRPGINTKRDSFALRTAGSARTALRAHSRSIAATWSRRRMRAYIFIALSRLSPSAGREETGAVCPPCPGALACDGALVAIAPERMEHSDRKMLAGTPAAAG